jgi:hypothetical protein
MTTDQIAFKGSPDQRNLAEQVYKIMTAQGRFFADDAPIRQTLANLADFFASQQKADRDQVAKQIEDALQENGAVFQRENRDSDVVYVTTRKGAYVPRVEDSKNMFRNRLYQPANPLPVDDISVVVTTTRPALTTIEPVFISDYWQQQAGILPMPGDEAAVGDEVVEEPIAIEPATPAPEVVEAAPEPVAVEEAPSAERAVAVNTVITMPNGLQIDLRRSVDELMAQHGALLTGQLRQAIDRAIPQRIVMFGNQAYPEIGGSGFGKNDLRRIRDYLLEAGEPLLDTQILSDIFRYNPSRPDYESFRFELNYRLDREKDFEFVGVEGARLWTTKGMPTIGTKRLKASEMGQLTGYLEEGFDDSLADQSAESIRKAGSLTHILTFFEWEYGVLPYTRALATLLPSALLPDQRTVVLRFEAPQHYVASLVELRYPTGNRGGWIQGLDGFFHEYLVPGAMITISRTEQQHIFTITYEEQPETTDRLLVMDEKKNKLAFEDLTYYAAVDSDMLLTQQNYGRLRNLKLFPMSERRKGEAMLDHVAATVGEPVGTRAEPRYSVTRDLLLVALNVLRPASNEYMLHLLKENELFQENERMAGGWLYTPPAADEDEDEDEDEDLYEDDDE